MSAWAADLAEVRARVVALNDGDLASAKEAAVRWRFVDPFSGFFLPLPLVARDTYSAYGEWRAIDDPRGGRADLAGLDVLDRPVVHLLDPRDLKRPKRLWWWDEDGSFLEIELMGSGPHVRRARVVDGRLAHVATATRGAEHGVQLVSWTDGRVARVDAASVSAFGGRAWARVAELAADGTLSRLHSAAAVGAPGDLPACLELAAGLRPGRVVWDARVDRPEAWPGARAALRRAEPLAIALDEALRTAAQATEVLEPFLLEVFSLGDFKAQFPPIGRLIDAQWRDRMRRSSIQDGAALFETYKAADAGITVDLEVADRLDADALRTCRMLSSAFRPGAPWSLSREARPVADAVGDHLARLLNRTPLGGAADPFLAAVFVGSRFPSEDRFARTRAAVGEQRFTHFLESISSTKPRGAAAGKLRERARRALADREALETFFAEGGLPAHAARLAHEVAEEGLLLLPAGDVPVRSRLGGPPLLPANESWPEPLTFLAGIDLTELPPSRLPSSGWLLFYVDLGTGDEGGLVDEAANELGSPARLFWSDNTVRAAGPALKPRPVKAHPFLTLPDPWSAGQTLGLDVYERQTYEELADRLDAALPAGNSRHWIGGHANGAQGVPLDADTVLVLSMDDDSHLGFHFLDAGTVQFRMPPGALAEHDFSRAIAFADSG